MQAVSIGQVDDSERQAWNRPVKPFRVVGNIYYVGAEGVASYLITTPQGHILMDSGFAETVPRIQDSLNQLGFKLEDVKVLINSHAHFDHAGGFAQLKKLTGAKLMISEADAKLISDGGRSDFQWGDNTSFHFEPAVVDRLLRDKDKVELGGVTMIARITPGHTKGCTTWTMKVREAGRDLDVVFVGSTTIPGYKLLNNSAYPNIVEDYAYTFALLKTLPMRCLPRSARIIFWFRREKSSDGEGRKDEPVYRSSKLPALHQRHGASLSEAARGRAEER